MMIRIGSFGCVRCALSAQDDKIPGIGWPARSIAGFRRFASRRSGAIAPSEDCPQDGAVLSDAEPVIEKLRSVSGVEIAIVLKEHEPEKVYVSLRSKSYVSVLDIARELGGGGHPKAAGCNLRMTIQEAEEKVLKAAEGHLE